MMDADFILNRFPIKYGIYRPVQRNRLLRAIRFGWRVISSEKDGRILMWWGGDNAWQSQSY